MEKIRNYIEKNYPSLKGKVRKMCEYVEESEDVLHSVIEYFLTDQVKVEINSEKEFIDIFMRLSYKNYMNKIYSRVNFKINNETFSEKEFINPYETEEEEERNYYTKVINLGKRVFLRKINLSELKRIVEKYKLENRELDVTLLKKIYLEIDIEVKGLKKKPDTESLNPVRKRVIDLFWKGFSPEEIKTLTKILSYKQIYEVIKNS